MLKYKNRIEGIRNTEEFLISEDKIFHLSHVNQHVTQLVISNSGGSQIWAKDIDIDVNRVFINNEKIFVPLSQLDVLTIDLKDNYKVNILNGVGFLDIVITEDISLFKCRNDEGRNTPTLIKNAHKIWQLPNPVSYIFFSKEYDIIIGFSKYDEWKCIDFTFIQTDNLETGKTLWHFTLESLHQAYEGFSEKWDRPMEIANFCGVANEVLWMDVVCRGIGNFLLGLDVHTGQPVHLLDKAKNRFERYPFDMIPTDGRTTYDAKRNILFGFAPDWVHWQVDLSEKSPKIKMWDLTEEVTPRNAYVSAYMNCGISYSHIFFPVGSLGSTPQVFALNRETLKVDWQYYFTEGGQYFTPTKIEVTDTHLYVLDNTGTLHIFEKTEDN
jgi:outer membrane protein assembly factor BamB